MSDRRKRNIAARNNSCLREKGRKSSATIFKRLLQQLMVCYVLFFTTSAFAFDFAAPFVDPLFSVPDIITSGVSLPGDSKPAPCPATKDFSRPLALGESVDLALCNNPQIKGAWAAIKVQAGAVGEARSAYLPTVSGTINFLRTNTDYPGSAFPSTSKEGSTLYATIGLRLFDFGTRDSNLQSSNHLLVSAAAHHNAILQKTLANVVQAYFDAHTAKATLQAKKQNETIAKNILVASLRREKLGAGDMSESLQATTTAVKAALERSRAHAAYQKSLSVLLFTMGVPLQTRVILSEDLTAKGKDESLSLDEWLKTAAKSHPAIASAREQFEASRHRVASARSESYPTVDVSANFYQNGYPGQDISSTKSQANTIGLYMTFPFFNGFSRTYKIRSAEAQAEQYKAELQDSEYNILLEVVKAYEDAAASVQNLQDSDTLVSVAENALDTVQRKYEKGAANIVEILNTQSALSDARQERIRSLAEWHSSRLRLLANVGVMGRNTVIQ